MRETVLEVRNLQVEFPGDGNTVKALDGISFALHRGETLGIVGESGSGKSVTALAVMGLLQTPGIVTGGEIWFRPQENGNAIDLVKLPPEQMQLHRGGDIAMIFQEPMSSLNPVYNIGFQLTEAIMRHQNVSAAQARQVAIAGLQEVKLLPSDELRSQVCKRLNFYLAMKRSSSSISKLGIKPTPIHPNQNHQSWHSWLKNTKKPCWNATLMNFLGVSCNG